MPVNVQNSGADEQDGPARLLKAGLTLVGSVVSAGVGNVVAGPEGVLAGAVMGPALTSSLEELAHRTLGRREQARVGAAALAAQARFVERTEGGEALRDDGWFSDRDRLRSRADELVEGSLLAAQRDHDKRKVQHYGYLLANLAFEPSIDEYLANWLIEQVESLSWAQLLLLAAVMRKDELRVPSYPPRGASFDPLDNLGTGAQLSDLGFAKRELVRGVPPDPVPEGHLPTIESRVQHLKLTDSGKLLFVVLSLEKIPFADCQGILGLLDNTEVPA